MSLRHHEIAEANHRILNPFTDEKLMTLGTICRLQPGQRLLDLACGKGEMLCRWAQHFGIGGLGIDISEVFLAAAQARAAELGIASQVTFKRGDAGKVGLEAGAFDLVSCIGATWIGGGLRGTLDLMRPAVRTGGLVLVGEPYWLAEPPPDAYQALQCKPDDFTSLLGTSERVAAGGVELVEMVLADQDSWDRYVAAQWWTVSEWLRDHPGDPESPGLRRFLENGRRSNLAYGRQYLAWGVFVGRLMPRNESD
ncbi:MAG: SAM-dependent methyltransferase [Chloroflexota bacterium]